MIDSGEIRAIASIMREFGIASIKTGAIELVSHSMPVTANSDIPRSFAIDKPATITPEEEKDIKHKVESFKSIMQTGDVELLNRLFPIEQEEEADE